MWEMIKELPESTVALFAGIGGALFVPIALVSLFIGYSLAGRMTVRATVIVLGLSAILYLAWSTVFVFSYEFSPGNFEYHISGWRLTPPAEAFLQRDPALSAMSRERISAELMKSFKAPENVWLGTDLTAVRAVGSVMMAFVLISVGMIVGSLKPSK